MDLWALGDNTYDFQVFYGFKGCRSQWNSGIIYRFFQWNS